MLLRKEKLVSESLNESYKTQSQIGKNAKFHERTTYETKDRAKHWEKLSEIGMDKLNLKTKKYFVTDKNDFWKKKKWWNVFFYLQH